MKKILFLLIAVLCFACNRKKAPEEIIIEGNVQGIPDGKIYLVNAYWVTDVRDSTDCVDGRFRFVIKPDSSFVPYLASINFGNRSKPKDFKSLMYRNHMKGPDSMKSASSAFYLEKGLTRITGNNKKIPYLRVYAGRETDIAFAKEYRFGGIRGLNPVQRQQKIDQNASEIRKHPYSYFLLQNLFFNKAAYSESELKQLLALFHPPLRESKLGDEFRTYFTNRIDPGEAYSQMLLLNANGKRQPAFDPESKLNMLVFWSSWCGPCRREIPVFKEIEQEYKGKGLNLVSISIDEYKDRWTQALAEEKMGWPQLIVDADKITTIQQKFNFNFIPLVVFTDNAGREIARFSGNSEGQKKKYLTVINRYLMRDI